MNRLPETSAVYGVLNAAQSSAADGARVASTVEARVAVASTVEVRVAVCEVEREGDSKVDD